MFSNHDAVKLHNVIIKVSINICKCGMEEKHISWLLNLSRREKKMDPRVEGLKSSIIIIS